MTTKGPGSSRRAEQQQESGTASSPPDDAQELREEIERTREQLGDTVEALMAKADVKARAQEKAGQFAERMKTTAVQAGQQAAARVGQVQSNVQSQVRSQIADKTAAPRHKAMSATETATSQVRQRAAAAIPAVRQRAATAIPAVRQRTAAAAAAIPAITPEPVRRAAAKAAATAGKRRVPVAVTIGAAVTAWLIIRQWRRR